MKLLVLGATGGTGRQVVVQALERGHQVSVLVRHPERLQPVDGRVEVHTGSATDPAAVDQALDGAGAVVCTLGSRNLGALLHTRLIRDSVEALVTAMESHAVRRLVLLSALGAGGSAAAAPPLLRLTFATALRAVGADKAAGEARLRSSHLDWTTVHPPALTDAPPTGQISAGPELRLRGVPKLSRADVAAFMLDQLNDATHLRQAVVLGP